MLALMWAQWLACSRRSYPERSGLIWGLRASYIEGVCKVHCEVDVAIGTNRPAATPVEIFSKALNLWKTVRGIPRARLAACASRPLS
jgi:hypothetical protein